MGNIIDKKTILDRLYKVESNGFSNKLSVIDLENNQLPKSLFRICAVNKYSVDSLLNNYIFGNHPRHFNDLFDCHKELIIIDDDNHKKLIKSFIKEYYKDVDFDSVSEQKQASLIEEAGYDLAYITFGISCFTSNPNNLLMWAYYCNNSGFMIEYDYSIFPENFQGPFPINYLEKIKPISIKENGPNISLLYQSNIKSIVWGHECEWRYLIRSSDAKPLVPYGNFEFKNAGLHDRKFNYPEESVLSISFGNRFFSPNEILEVSKEQILKVKFDKSNDDRIKILNYCIENPQVNACFALTENDLTSISFRKSKIEKKGKLEYWIR